MINQFLQKLINNNPKSIVILNSPTGDDIMIDFDITYSNFGELLYNQPPKIQKTYFKQFFESPEEAEKYLRDYYDDFIEVCYSVTETKSGQCTFIEE